MINKKIKVLIVEDENIIALDIKRTVKKLGYEPLATVSSGEKAIEKVKEELPDMILMDINLKGTLSGIEAANIICSEYKTPVIFLTALNNIKNLTNFNLAHTTHLIKPFEEHELKSAMSKVLSC